MANTNGQSIDLLLVIEAAKKAAEAAELVLLRYFGQLNQVQEKYRAGLVSEADIESEKVIYECLRTYFPNIPFIGEESSFSQGDKLAPDYDNVSEYYWIVDPLDGTTNYVYEFHIFCISIGLERRGEPIAGVVRVPLLKKVYSAFQGGGAFLNDQPIHVSDRKKLSDALVATGFSTQDQCDMTDQIQVFARILNLVRGVRRPGAAAFDLCLVAQGVFDAFWEKNLKSWDTCAGVILVKEAGGQVTNYIGDQFQLLDQTILASNPHVYNEIQTLLAGPR